MGWDKLAHMGRERVFSEKKLVNNPFKESKSEILKLCRYGYGNFKKQKTIIPSLNMILNTTVQIFRLLLSRKYFC